MSNMYRNPVPYIIIGAGSIALIGVVQVVRGAYHAYELMAKTPAQMVDRRLETAGFWAGRGKFYNMWDWLSKAETVSTKHGVPVPIDKVEGVYARALEYFKANKTTDSEDRFFPIIAASVFLDDVRKRSAGQEIVKSPTIKELEALIRQEEMKINEISQRRSAEARKRAEDKYIPPWPL